MCIPYKPRIVILGAGYGGLLTAVHLQNLISQKEAEIILVNKHDYHYQTTLLHEVAGGTGEENHICIPIREVIDIHRVHFIKDTIAEIQKEKQEVILYHGDPITYDYLVIGLGFEPATFSIPGILEHALTIKSMNAARRIRDKIETLFADFSKEKNSNKKISIIVGGAGFTGIELVGELAEQIQVLCKKYNVERQSVQLMNVEAGLGILGGFDTTLASYAKDILESKGVEFRLSTKIKLVDEQGVIINSENGEEKISPATVIWTGGVQGNTVACGTCFESIRGRIPVEKDLRVKGYKNVFVIGDCSAFMDEQAGRPFPPTAQLAVMQSKTCAKNLVKLVRGDSNLEAFSPSLKGAVASLGAKDGVGNILGLKARGKMAVLTKLMVDNRYLFILGGFKLLFRRGRFRMSSVKPLYTVAESK